MKFIFDYDYLESTGEYIPDDVKKYNYAIPYQCNFTFATSSAFNKCFKKASAKAKSMMYYYMLKYKKDIIFLQDSQEYLRDNNNPYKYNNVIANNELNSEFPDNPYQRMSMVLENLVNYNPTLGKSICFGKTSDEMSKRPDIVWLFMPGNDDIKEAWEMYQFLLSADYLKIHNGGSSTDSSCAILTEKAWNYIIPKKEAPSKNIFIAMSYSGTAELNFYEKAVKEAINKCGYTPMIIRDKEHIDYIPLEIEYEISHSSALIADLTGQNNGVYYEAGLAKGKNIPVIFTCNKPEIEGSLEEAPGKNSTGSGKIHFDVAQINTIFWQYNEQKFGELKDRLIRRIKSILDK